MDFLANSIHQVRSDITDIISETGAFFLATILQTLPLFIIQSFLLLRSMIKEYELECLPELTLCLYNIDFTPVLDYLNSFTKKLWRSFNCNI